jgi:predicted RNA-binding protein with PIN domain
MRFLVDGMNVIGSRPDGWWRDRDGAERRLVERLVKLAKATDDDISVVFDGRPLPDLPEGEHDGIRVLYARRPGPNAADDRIVEEVQGDDNPRGLTVVTSDRLLAERVGKLGARVMGAGALLERLDKLNER